MTNNHENLLATFEVRVNDLISFCDKLKEESMELQQALALKDAEISQLKQVIKELHAEYNNLLIAKIISVQESEMKEAQQRLSKLVREVDKCIALLNE
ncbi:hypothetical protein [Parabacteroides pacaensis]|uniref:hypothetical protein n=1 Tax=Parabacteroides pacaensis TaxID=2086575 RepID=UPI000D10AA9E|nr:hypothetical protein [Parabacteroides pacaensis]